MITEDLKVSLTILQELDNQLAELTGAALEAYRNLCENNSQNNRVIVWSVYGFLLIRACAFYDELTQQYQRLATVQNDAELNKGIAFYKGLFTNYDMKSLRNYLAHNRKRQAGIYSYIEDQDIDSLRTMKSHPEHNGFSVGSTLIMKSLHRLYPMAFEEMN
jgi:hypothetical protein